VEGRIEAGSQAETWLGQLVARLGAGWIELVSLGCICRLRIAVAAALEADRFLWLAAVLLGCFKC
jgi:hypothetical protein